MNLSVQADFFNRFNMPGNGYTPIDDTGIVTNRYSQNSPRVMQLSVHPMTVPAFAGRGQTLISSLVARCKIN